MKVSRSNIKPDVQITLGLLAVLVFFLLTAVITYFNMRTIDEDAQQVVDSHRTLVSLSDLLSEVKSAETGQRGYVLTGSEEYLEPYKVALSQISTLLADVTVGLQETPDEEARLKALKEHLTAKLGELKDTVDLRREKGFDAALALIKTNRGKQDMDALVNIVGEIRDDTAGLRRHNVAEMESAHETALISGVMTSLLGGILAIAVAVMTRRTARQRIRQAWLQAGLIGVSNALTGEHLLPQLGDKALRYFAEYMGAQVGAFFAREGDSFRRVAAYGLPADAGISDKFVEGEGLLGQAARDARVFAISDVPKGYLSVGSSLGNSLPRHLVIAPAGADGNVEAVFELGFMDDVDDAAFELLDRASEAIGVAIRSAIYRANLQNLLEETQRQAEELQAQGEELRVTNEELEQQSRVLQESQARMEQQQAELEQTNTQLEDQAEKLQEQRDDLASAQHALEARSRDLEAASKYKSEFLANMSHELRTPLNSSLILAKLLADNPEGNLSDEQVRYAETIQSSGNDLLGMINDILDLSKIEAGRMEIRPERFPLARIATGMNRAFEPMAAEKNIRFSVEVKAEGAADIEADSKRLEQILRNLIANAIKFTENGEVHLLISTPSAGRVAFAIKDTGIGISADQHEIIFEAFRQADSTTSRKYGGTGLGLSISRELARLMGGEIHLESVPGKGSTFTLELPQVYVPRPILAAPANYNDAAPPAPPPRPARLQPSPSPRPRPAFDDDRDSPKSGRRTILVVEDDTAFARILYDLAQELKFRCIVTGGADEALEAAMRYMPDAVILDIGLPDHSGLSVLDRLKQDNRTRHIPVHVVSGGDYTRAALSLGAAGYILKPVKRDELVLALQEMGDKLSQQLRRVLVVEDDPVQRESLKHLLKLHNVETVDVGTAAECLDLLQKQTFDCMVLDLSLPDASGYQVLETLSKGQNYAFPPAIVYTGRDLTADEEQQLRRYSRSIIIKGAKSPERLLDEVTLFLHHVVADMSPEKRHMLKTARSRDVMLEGRRILVVEDDVRNIYSLTSLFEPRGVLVQVARNGREALTALDKAQGSPDGKIDLVLMDVMMPEMDGLTATAEIRKRQEWKKLPIIMLTAKAMRDDQERCLNAGANDYMAKPLDVDKLMSLVRVWMPR